MVKLISTKTLYRVLLFLNILAIAAMLFVGEIGLFNPSSFPVLSTLGLGFPILLIINLIFMVLWILIRFKYVWVSIIGFLFCYTPIRTYIPFNIPQDTPADAIKVLSFNVYLFSTWDFSKQQNNPIIDYIVESNADIVCLQESHTDELTSSQLQKLFKNYPYRDVISHMKPGDKNMITLSKYPIIAKEQIEYNSQGNLSMAYQLRINGKKVLLINNHFESYQLNETEKNQYKDIVKGNIEAKQTSSKTIQLIKKIGKASAIRSKQVDTVMEYIKKYEKDGTPIILCGDFNDSPISYAHRKVSKQLIDCFVASGNGPGITYHSNKMYFRIDHIFCSKEFIPYSAKVDSKLKYSDHYPIYTFLKYNTNN